MGSAGFVVDAGGLAGCIVAADSFAGLDRAAIDCGSLIVPPMVWRACSNMTPWR